MNQTRPRPTAGRNTWTARWFALAVGLAFATGPAHAGTWTPVANTAPGGVQLMLLLTDGTIACYDGGAGDWFKLTPNASGSYINGSWTAMASMNDTRRYCSSQVLRDGRILMAGGEYGTGTNTAELYNPLTDTWTYTPLPGVISFVDSCSMMLPDGRVLISPVRHGSITFGTKIYNPVANTWINGPATLKNQNETSWVKLPDDSILTVDVNTTSTERYIPSLNIWKQDAPCSTTLYGVGSEIGPAMLLPDGRAFFLGGNGNTAFYTPSGTTNNGTWTTGPDIPNSLACPDAPGAVMVNGKVLFTCNAQGFGTNTFVPPTSYYEYDPVANTYTQQNAPNGGLTENRKCFTTCMLCLPDGNVLYSDQGSQLFVYQPVGAALATAKPTLSGINWRGDGTVRLTGTKFNGLNAGAAYGDDLQMDSNYPLVRFTSGGSVYYGRTYNWSSTGVATGSENVSTEASLPSVFNVAPNTSFSAAVVANGVPSTGVTFYGPVWVNFGYSGLPLENGWNVFPWNTMAEGVSAVTTGGTIAIKASSRNEPITITKAMTIISVGGSTVIGQ